MSKIIELDDDNEDWIRTVRAAELKKRGWKGTVAEWVAMTRKLGKDPLDQDPPITSPKSTPKKKSKR